MSTPEQRKRLKAYLREHECVFGEWKERGYGSPLPEIPKMPDDLKELQCGAKSKRTGQPCKRKDIFANGRCKFHGGLSTGPKTAEGKKRASQNACKKQSP